MSGIAPVCVWYSYGVTVMTTLKDLPFAGAAEMVAEGAAFVDVRPAPAYLEVHIPGSLSLPYEFGPGLASRARDCLPLDVPLVLLDDADADMPHVAASLRGKGFDVIGRVRDGLREWGEAHGPPRSTETITQAAPGSTILDVDDPGARAPDNAMRIPLERLWLRVSEITGPVTVVGGFGLRAALAIGILERSGFGDLYLLQTR
jgi:rhodanese-related sulfurtransferase